MRIELKIYNILSSTYLYSFISFTFLLLGFEPELFRDGSADSHGKAHKSKKKKKDKKHKKHKKHKHEHKDKLDKLDKFIQEENLSSGSSNPPSPASPGSMGGSVSNSMASNMSFWASAC